MSDEIRCHKCGTNRPGVWGVDKSGWLCAPCWAISRGERINLLESALREFCQRVERGEIRSVRTYRKFKELLGEGQPL